MKNLILFLFFMPLIAHSQAGNNKNYVPDIKKTNLEEYGSFYIISVSGTADIKEAVEQVKGLKAKGHPAGYLWIPDFPSLSNKELYSVFIGPFERLDSTIEYLEKYKKTNANAYAVEASKSTTRTTVFGKFDIRKNNIKQFLILTYAKPKDVEEYYNNGGEDWGWFTGDVGEYFRKNYPDSQLSAHFFVVLTGYRRNSGNLNIIVIVIKKGLQCFDDTTVRTTLQFSKCLDFFIGIL